MESAKILIDQIFKIKQMSICKLAQCIQVEPSTVLRILNGKTVEPKLKTYMRLIEFKSKLSQGCQTIHGGSQ